MRTNVSVIQAETGGKVQRNEIMVSVCMITYNHENFIRRAIEGVLAQEVNFPFELLIFNDASTDNTDGVIRNLMQTHPKAGLIKYGVHEKNIGLPANYAWSINNCKGNFIAICEGDDYWIDPKKLQKQVDLLEQNPACSFCFHQALRIDTVTNQYSVYPVNDRTIFDAASFFQMTTIPMASVVFRNSVPRHFVNGHMQLDFALLCNLLSHGTAYFLPEVMSVYRVHPNAFTANKGLLSYMQKMISDIREASGLQQYSKPVRRQVARVYMLHVLRLIEAHGNKISRGQRVRYLLQFLKTGRPSRLYLPLYRSLLASVVK
ncbi:glycosyltransferase [Flavisolibacter sp. BT320]|nr:glycosyltransferase [Flavisolibacter longurius]